MTKPAILLMSFGTPSDVSQLTSFYRRIQHGRYPQSKLINRIAQRYEMMGGLEYFSTIAYQQGAGIAASLKNAGVHCPISMGFLHATPSIESRVKDLIDADVTEIYGFPLCTYYSNFQSEFYHRAALSEINSGSSIFYHRVNGLWNQPALLSYWQEQLVAAKRRHPWKKEDTQFLFIADAMPKKISKSDPYRHSVELNARRITNNLGLTKEQYAIGWISSPKIFQTDRFATAELRKTVRRQIVNRHAKTLVVVPIGFLSDSLVLDYDICVELRKYVNSFGASMVQLPVPNASQDLIKAVTHKLILSMDHHSIYDSKDDMAINENQ